MQPLDQCANGCDRPPDPPSKVICRPCQDRIMEKLELLMGLAGDPDDDLGLSYERLKKQAQELANTWPSNQQRADWAYGNARTSNDRVTREMAEQAVARAEDPNVCPRCGGSTPMVEYERYELALRRIADFPDHAWPTWPHRCAKGCECPRAIARRALR